MGKDLVTGRQVERPSEARDRAANAIDPVDHARKVVALEAGFVGSECRTAN